jgi:gluconolactonase
VNDSEKGHIRVFDVKPDGTLESGQVFAELKDPGKKGVNITKVHEPQHHS